MSQPDTFTQSRSTTSFVGMAIFMGAWAMMLAALLFAYFDVRLQASQWPPAGEPRLPHDVPALATFVLFSASYTLERARRRGQWSPRSPVMLGLAFLLLQAFVWWQMARQGLHATSPFGAAFFTITIFHALHVGVAMLGLSLARSDNARRNWRIFWHGLGVAWIVIFVAVYLA
jgi:cytochrome c oxidase subunit 3